MHRNLTLRVLSLAFLTASLALPATADSDLWLHVRVDEAGGAKVSVNLPLTMIEAALAMLPEEHFHGGRIVIDDHDWRPEDLRAAWLELRDSPDMTFITVEDEYDSVRVSKEGGYVLISALERAGQDEEVDVKLPIGVVDALFSGDGDGLDLAAAVEALADHGAGELVTVSGGDDQVRVWIDRVAEAE